MTKDFAKRKIRQIAYFGFADAKPGDKLYKEAYELSKFLSSHGFVCINGGGPGVMRATSEGAKEAHGTAVGVTFYPKDVANFEGRDPNNPLDIEVKTKNYLERTLKLLEFGDVYVVFNGGTGTLSEFGMAWGLARLYLGHHKPLILYGGFWYPVIEGIAKGMKLRGEELTTYRIVTTPEAALDAIEDFEKTIKQKKHRHEDEKAFQL